MCLPDVVNYSVANLNSYFVKKSGSGEPLIVLHGWGLNSNVWEPVRAALEEQFFVSWIDLPGHGENRDVLAKSMDEIVEFILPSIPDGAHLIGWSLGGLVAQALAEKINEDSSKKIKTITLVASTPRFSQSENWQNAMSLEVLNNFANQLQIDLEGTLKRFIALQFMGIKEAKKLQRDLTQRVLSAPPQMSALELGLKILTESDFRHVKHNIPQHWILAKRDRLIPIGLIKDLKWLRPDDQITLLENAGHAPFMTHPENFVSSLTAFINTR